MDYKKFILFITPWILIALIMNLVRFALTDVHSYVYMNWNLLLAFIALFFLFLFEKSVLLIEKIVFFTFWIFFFPNAVYMITDFIHLRNVGPDWLLWYDAMMIFAYASIGVFISSYSLIRMHKKLFILRSSAFIFSLFVALISSFGVYLGRYHRFNSWDIVSQPSQIVKSILEIFSTQSGHPVFITTIIFFTLFILLSTESLRKIFEQR